jgi:hypothetical protein
MPSEAERQAFNISPPEASNTAGEGVTILAATTSAAAAAIPEAYAHRYVYLQAEGDKIWIAFGPAASPDIDKSNAGGSTFAAGTVNDNAVPIPNGIRIPVRLHPTRHAYIKWQADSTAAKLIVWPTTPASTSHGT